MAFTQIESDFLRYLVAHGCEAGTRLPSLSQISDDVGVSVGKLREQMEVARCLGLVDVRPRRGIECNEYSFHPAVYQSLIFALMLDRTLFSAYSTLRGQLEIAFWDEAVRQLQPSDHEDLLDLVNQAWRKLQQDRIQIPHPEHRSFHMTIFKRLGNPFVLGLLESYWDAYEAVELNTYADYSYLTAVWEYHERIAQSIAAQQFAEAKQLHSDHMQLLSTRGVTLNDGSPIYDESVQHNSVQHISLQQTGSHSD